MNLKGMLTSIALVGLGNLWVKGAIFLLTVLAAHMLSTQSFAVFSIFAVMLFSVTNVMSAAFQLGISRFVAEEPSHLRQITHNRTTWGIALGMGLVLSMATLAWLHYEVVPLGMFDSLSILGAILVSLLFACGLGEVQGRRNFLLYAQACLLSGGLCLAGAAIGLYFLGPIALFASVLVGGVTGMMYLARHIGVADMLKRPEHPFARSDNQPAWHTFRQVILPAALAGFITVPSVWLVVRELNSQGAFVQVALYSVGLHIRNILTLLPATFGSALLPLIASFKGQRSLRQFDFHLSYGISYFLIFPLILLPHLPVLLFGEGYVGQAEQVVLYMLFSAVIICYKASIGRQLIIVQQGFVSVMSNGSWLGLYLLLFYLTPAQAGAEDYARCLFYSLLGHLLIWFPFYVKRKLVDSFQYRSAFMLFTTLSLLTAYVFPSQGGAISALPLLLYVAAAFFFVRECLSLIHGEGVRNASPSLEIFEAKQE